MRVKLKVASGVTGHIKKPGDVVEVSRQKARYLIKSGQAVAYHERAKPRAPEPKPPERKPPEPVKEPPRKKSAEKKSDGPKADES